MFRHRPSELFFPLAQENDIGIIVRVPLASGLLSGKFTRKTTFGPDDHRTFNRDGAAFDKGETFSGVDFETGLEAVDELEELFPDDPGMAIWALRWVLMFDAVSCVIPGASKLAHIESNAGSSDLPSLTDEQMAGVKAVYEKYIKDPVHYLW
jgi:aryl-alcohol dehydrogenase-like predicted oxidoreductase